MIQIKIQLTPQVLRELADGKRPNYRLVVNDGNEPIEVTLTRYQAADPTQRRFKL